MPAVRIHETNPVESLLASGTLSDNVGDTELF